MTRPLSAGRLAEIRELAAEISADPWVLSDCEGWLKVWRESALTHVTRGENGEIDGFSEPSSHRVADLIVEIELDSWDLGEDATDDQRRADVGVMFGAREAVPELLAEVAHLTAERDDLAALVAELQQSTRNRPCGRAMVHPDHEWASADEGAKWCAGAPAGAR